MMKKTIISSDALGESYYCYRHSSGLEVALYPMPQFSSVYALFGTRYGSIDNMLCEPDGTKTEVPEGIAHYLEHKMFEKEDGDVSAHFSAMVRIPTPLPHLNVRATCSAQQNKRRKHCVR